MATKRIILYDLPDEIVLIVEHPTGVYYQNQVGGNVCWQAEVEGILSPLDVGSKAKKCIQDCSYPNGRQGITPDIADIIDSILAASPSTCFLNVDRARLNESWEAWIYVLIESSEKDMSDPSGVYHGPLYGFGNARGVLTWPNSD